MKKNEQFAAQVDFKEQTPCPQLEPFRPVPLYAKAFLNHEEPDCGEFAANTAARD